MVLCLVSSSSRIRTRNREYSGRGSMASGWQEQVCRWGPTSGEAWHLETKHTKSSFSASVLVFALIEDKKKKEFQNQRCLLRSRHDDQFKMTLLIVLHSQNEVYNRGKTVSSCSRPLTTLPTCIPTVTAAAESRAGRVHTVYFRFARRRSPWVVWIIWSARCGTAHISPQRENKLK